jgi:FemAB family protein
MLSQVDVFKSMVKNTFSKVTYLADETVDWHSVLSESHLASSEYLVLTIHYHEAYLLSAKDVSFVIYDNNKPIAVWPLTLYEVENVTRLQSNCKDIIPPIFVANTSNKTIKKIYQQCFSLLKKFSLKDNVTLKICYSPMIDVLWQRIFSPVIVDINYQQYLIADIRGDITEIKKTFRKSYRSLINKGKKLWQPQLHKYMSDSLLKQFRLFHIRVSGKETRSLSTWKIQQKMVNNQEAFCITLHDEDHKLIAIGLFNISPLQVSYSVGVYDRDLFDLPLGHVIQFEAIQYMKALNVERYFLGNRYHLFEQKKPTEKEHSIGFFKEGFSSGIHIEANAHLAFD